MQIRIQVRILFKKMQSSLNKKELKILALIPARSGSKGTPKKNTVNLGGFPLLAYSIVAARLSKYINRTIVTTDDNKIADISKKFGAQAPFLRPKKISADTSLDIEFFQHALNWLRKHENYFPDLIVHLRPTTPLRDIRLIDRAILELLKDKIATSLRSAELIRNKTPYKMFKKRNGYCDFFGKDDFAKNEEYYNYPRQKLPLVYRPNGYVDIIIPKIILKTSQLHGKYIKAFVTEKIADIDTIEDLRIAEKLCSIRVYKILRNELRKIISRA